MRLSLSVEDVDELLEELELDEDDGSDGFMRTNALTSCIPEDRRMPCSFDPLGGILSLGSDFLLSPPVPSRLMDLRLSVTLSCVGFLTAGVSSRALDLSVGLVGWRERLLLLISSDVSESLALATRISLGIPLPCVVDLCRLSITRITGSSGGGKEEWALLVSLPVGVSFLCGSCAELCIRRTVASKLCCLAQVSFSILATSATELFWLVIN